MLTLATKSLDHWQPARALYYLWTLHKESKLKQLQTSTLLLAKVYMSYPSLIR
jgi:hypothetical protein